VNGALIDPMRDCLMRSRSSLKEEMHHVMDDTNPRRICAGLEINGYFPAEF
jgi:hypothetical protein